MKKRMKQFLVLLLSISMAVPVSDISILAESNESDEMQPLTIEQMELTGSGIETERTSEDTDLLEIYNRVKSEAPVLSEDGTKIILPDTGNENYEISLYGSSNQAVVAMDGTVTQPLEDMDVYLYYQVVNKETKENLHMDDPILVSVNGRYSDEQKKLQRPKVMPGIREWKGDEGTFAFNGTLVIGQEEVRAAAEIVEFYIEEMTDFEVEIKSGTAEAGEIALSFDETLPVGDEGYVMDIAETAQVKATSYTGIVYAGATIAQILMQNPEATMPKGLMRDYPQYEVRSSMLDVARFYMPLDYLEEVTAYAAFFKQNEIHIHINDTGGEQSASFRVESKKYPAINSGLNPDEVYSQEDYKQYQKNVKKYGIDVVTEIDTPAHAGFVGLYDESLMLDSFHIDLSKREPIEFMKSLFDEFLDGEDPVFQNQKFNIGTDEYTDGHSEEMRAYMDEMIKYVNAKGYQTRLWSGLNVEGKNYGGTTPVTNEAVFHFWAASFADLQVQLEGEYPMINNNDGKLYSVPEVGYYNDYLNISNLYSTWNTGIVPGNSYIRPGHPLLLGSEAALWYDAKLGVSEFDVFDRHRDQLMLMAEKNWYGEPTDGQSSSEFMERVELLGQKAPGVNPDRQVASKTEVIAEYDFSEIQDNFAADLSGNGYDAEIVGLKSDNEALMLNGKGYISLPFDTMGYPYTAEFDLYISSATGENAVLFAGKDGTMYYNYDGTGKIGYERKGYSYVFDYDVAEDVMNHFVLTCNTPDLDGQLRLFVNGVEVATGDYYNVQNSSREESSTFVLPTEEIGSGIHGYLKSLKITKRISTEVLQTEKNVALGKNVYVSGVEGGYGEDGALTYPQFDPVHAVDGNTATRISLDRANDAWLYVDLGCETIIDKIQIRFNELPNSYELQISDDAENWETVKRKEDLEDASSSYEVFVFEEAISARYVKYQQIQMFDHPKGYGTYSGNFSELEVYGLLMEDVQKVLDDAKQALAQAERTEGNAVFCEAMQESIETLESEMDQKVYTNIRLKMDLLKKYTENLLIGNTSALMTDKTELNDLLNEKLDLSLCDEETATEYSNAVMMGQSVYADVTSSQESVDSTVKAIKKAKLMLQLKSVGITTNCVIYQNNTEDLILDGDTATTFWKNGYQKSGDYIKISFREPFALESVQLIADRDILKYGALKISEDGLNFETVAALEQVQDQTIVFEEAVDVLGIMIEAVQDNDEAWWRLNEVLLNGTSSLPLDKEVLAFELAKNIDGTDYTESSYSTYVQAKEEALQIYQMENANQAQIDDAVIMLRTAISNLEELVDKTLLQSLVENPIENRHLYTEASMSEYEKALARGQEVLAETSASQKDVESAIWLLKESMVYLEEKQIQLPYIDVQENDWFYPYVYDAYVKNLMVGITPTEFRPEEKLDRAQLASILYRMEGSPEVEFETIFTDVADGYYYSKAVIWAAKNHIVSGYEDGTYGPNHLITREQMVTMMYRYAMYKGLDVSAKTSLGEFADGNLVSPYAIDAMEWCVAEDIIHGSGDGTNMLNPQGSTSRAEAATIISLFQL